MSLQEIERKENTSMRIAIDMLLAERLPGGMLLATRALLDGLAQVDKENKYVIITGQPESYQHLAADANIQLHPVQVSAKRGLLFKHQLLMSGVLRQIRPDLLHTPAFAAPILWRGPLVVTVHDLAFLKVPHQS